MSTDQIIDPVSGTPMMGEDQALAYTQAIRVGAVRELLKGGKLPEDRSDRAVLFQALDGIDKVALTNKRIKADSAAAAGITAAASTVAALLRQSGSYYGKPADIEEVPHREVPELSREIPEPVLVPGETDVATPQMDYDSFMARMKGGEDVRA